MRIGVWNKNRELNNYNYKEENANKDIVNEQSDDEESEESHLCIIEVESYFSPTFRKVDNKLQKIQLIMIFIIIK